MAHQYTLAVDTTGIRELSPPDQRTARAATAGIRQYSFNPGGTGTIISEGGLRNGTFPFSWSLQGDTLHLTMTQAALSKGLHYIVSRDGRSIYLRRGGYRAWLNPF